MKFNPDTVQTRMPSPLGDIYLAATAKGLCGLWFTDNQRYLPPALSGPSAWREDPGNPVLAQAQKEIEAYFAGQRSVFDMPLDLDSGTPFQQSVWRALLAIPLGETLSYGDVSQRIGNPSAVRAVGGAVGRNPISIIVPCHRVMGSNGSLTGYGGGLNRKTALLQLEGVMEEKLL